MKRFIPKKISRLTLLMVCLFSIAAVAAPVTLRTLSAGIGISDGDLFESRQGADTVDHYVTGTQFKTYIDTQNLSVFGATTSSQLAGVLSDETGSGLAVFGTSPTLVTPILGTPTSVTLTNGTGLPISTGLTGAGAGCLTFLATPTSANIAACLTDETGSGAAVFATSPTLVTPILGTPTSVTLTNGTGLPISTGLTGQAAGIITFMTTPSSANLITAVTDETGTGALVFGTSPSLTTPALGTPSAIVLTNGTSLPLSGLLNQATNTIVANVTSGSAAPTAVSVGSCSGAGNALIWTTNTGPGCNSSITAAAMPASGLTSTGTGVNTWLATPSSANLIAAITDETGTGAAVFATSPTLVTPNLGTPSTLVGTNITGTGASFTAGNVTTNANLTGDITSVGNASTYNNAVPALKGGFLSKAAGGTADALTATYTPALTLADQTICIIVPASNNATTTPTFAPNSLTAHTITKNGGSALAANDLVALKPAILQYNLANTRWELLNPSVTSSSGTAPTYQILTSGTTYTTPANVKWIEVTEVGGGAGGGATNTNAGGNGGASSFNSITAAGGTGGGAGAAGNGGAGGTGGTGTTNVIWRRPGGDGDNGFAGSNGYGGRGGSNSFYRGSIGTYNAIAGVTPPANEGVGGGGGGNAAANIGGGGGGAGEEVFMIISSPSATYTYAIGTRGLGGAAGTSAGLNGSTGFIVVREAY